MDTPERVSVYGKRVWWDWQLAAVYQSRKFVPPVIAQHQPDPLAPPVIHPEEAPTDDLQIPVQGQHGLVGRQAEMRQLERVLQANSVVLLSGRYGHGQDGAGVGVVSLVFEAGAGRVPGRRVLYGV